MSEIVSVRQWGNSIGIRIPVQVQKQLGINVNDNLKMELREDAIILRPEYSHKTFEERLAEYNNEISIINYDWGEPEGRELL